jgi:cyclopropane fatty-acyl-phospholipid synthase-like methyltransferase
MGDYLQYLEGLYSSKTFARKARYIEHNFGAWLKSGQTALEVGPGLGEFLDVLRRHGITDVDIVERDEAVLRRVAARFPVNRSWRVAAEGIAAVQGELRRYDVIVLSQVLEHVRKDALCRLVRTLYGCLNPGGRILITVPNGGNPLSVVERYSDLTHENVFSELALRQLVDMAGIQDAEVVVQGYRIPPASFVNILRIALQKALHLLLRAVMVINGGAFFRILEPNICLVIRRQVS